MASAVLLIYVIVSAAIGTFLLWYSATIIQDIVQEKENKEYKIVRGVIYVAIVFIWLMTLYSLGNFVYSLF